MAYPKPNCVRTALNRTVIFIGLVRFHVISRDGKVFPAVEVVMIIPEIVGKTMLLLVLVTTSPMITSTLTTMP